MCSTHDHLSEGGRKKMARDEANGLLSSSPSEWGKKKKKKGL